MGLHQAYPPKLTKPMREDLTAAGVEELLTRDDVEQVLGEGRQLVLINSVCGCSAANARPALKRLAAEGVDAQLLTVFAGVHREATAGVRGLIDEPPSSPSFALFVDGECVFFLPREQVEGRSADDVAADLREAMQ